jgi:3-oxoacyl-[acyl-carrier protein] reductase
MSNLIGKVAIVTGASRGIGRAIAQRLGADGAKVIVNYGGSAEEAKAVVQSIQSNGGEAIALKADMTQPKDIKQLFQEAETRFGQIDILVSNAGASIYKPFTDLTEDEFDRLFALNVKGTFLTVQEAVRRMSEDGRIICISTAATLGYVGLPYGSVYVATKGAVNQLVRSLAHELGQKGITINAIAPGTVGTDNLQKVSSPEMIEEWIKLTPLQRLGQPDDIADAVAFLASNDARWITGQIIPVNGGQV